MSCPYIEIYQTVGGGILLIQERVDEDVTKVVIPFSEIDYVVAALLAIKSRTKHTEPED